MPDAGRSARPGHPRGLGYRLCPYLLAMARWGGPPSGIGSSELPFFAGYLLIASTALALGQGDLSSAGGVIVAVAGLVVLLGLSVIVQRALRADAALHNPPPPQRPWRRILMAPLPAFRLDAVRVGNLSYGKGPLRNLDIYHRRDRPVGVPVVLHFHGGGFHSGNKRREARPLIGYLVSRGMVCASANYRLRPRVGDEEQLSDSMAAIEMCGRTHGNMGVIRIASFWSAVRRAPACRSMRSTKARTGSLGSSAGTATTGARHGSGHCHRFW